MLKRDSQNRLENFQEAFNSVKPVLRGHNKSGLLREVVSEETYKISEYILRNQKLKNVNDFEEDAGTSAKT